MKLAVVQTPGTELGGWRGTLALVEGLLAQAAAQGAELALLPECVWPSYCLGTTRHYFAARAAGMPGHDEFLRFLGLQARRHRLAICAGYVEERGGRLANTAAFIGLDGGILGVHRKCFLWDFDHDWFDAGDELRPFDTPFGRIGLMICADARLPEIPATLAARGAELVLQPTAWVNVGSPEHLWNPQPDFLIRARAREFSTPVASASKCGREGDVQFVGSSLICDADGTPLRQCGPGETQIVVADVHPRRPRPPEITGAERERLLSSRPPAAPRGDVPLLHLRFVAAQAAEEVPKAAAVPEAAAEQGGAVFLDIAPPGGPQGRVPSGASGDVPPRTEDLSPGAAVGAGRGPIELAGVRIVTAPAAAARHLAAARCHALHGTHVLVLFGEPEHPVLLQTRACENRIFIITAAPTEWSVVAPSGHFIARGGWPPVGSTLRTTIDPRQAAHKCVAPRSDVLTGRPTAIFAF